jgi:general secretion pathway protein B
MSFILDALKKSEMERQRQATPGLVESDIVRPRPRLPVWAIALCALLAVNLIVLIVMLTRGSQSSPPARAAGNTRPPPAASAGSDRSATHFSPLDAPAEYAPEIPGSDLSAAGEPAAGEPAAGVPPVSKPTPAVPAASASRTVHHRDPVLTNDDYKAGEESLPTINEISLTGPQALPDLHLDVHVYATQSAERFVFINMRKYHEGATLQEGPTIEHIRRDGVVLSYQGLRFLLPRQ